MALTLWLVRYGETAWSLSGHVDLVLSSPMDRAIETCRLAGLDNPVVDAEVGGLH